MVTLRSTRNVQSIQATAIFLFWCCFFFIPSAAATKQGQSWQTNINMQQQRYQQDRRDKDTTHDMLNNIVDGTFSIHFDSCLSIATEPTDAQLMLLNPKIAPFTARGQVQSPTSVVVFQVCDDELNCPQEHILELDTFLYSVMNRPVDESEKYCQACRDFMEYCFLDASPRNTGDRHLKKIPKRLRKISHAKDRELLDALLSPSEYVDCETCHDRNCFDSDDPTHLQQSEILDWMNRLLTCQPLTGLRWNNQALFASFMCNQDGSGVEVGIFLDPHCTIYTSALAFDNLTATKQGGASLATSRTTNIVASATLTSDLVSQVIAPSLHSSEIVTAPFLHPLPCANIQFTSLNAELTREIAAQEMPEGTEIWAMNSYCQSLLSMSPNLDTCRSNLLGHHHGHHVALPHQITMGITPSSTTLSYLLTLDQADDLNSICELVAWHRDSTKEIPFPLWHVYQEVDDFGAGSGQLYNYSMATLGGSSFDSNRKDDTHGVVQNTSKSSGLLFNSVWEVGGLLLVALIATAVSVNMIRAWRKRWGRFSESDGLYRSRR